MRCKVQLYVAGKVFDEIVEAKDYNDAKRTAIARNPSAKVISVTAVFGLNPRLFIIFFGLVPNVRVPVGNFYLNL